MNTRLLLSLSFLAVSALSAQSWSQPVREIEKEARSAVRGYCAQIMITSGAGTSGPCILSPLIGSGSWNTVPAGKILVIEDVNIRCSKHSSDSFAAIRLQPSLYFRDFNLTLRYTGPDQNQVWGGSFPVRMYGKPDSEVTMSLSMSNNVTGLATCRIDFVGHLVNAQ